MLGGVRGGGYGGGGGVGGGGEDGRARSMRGEAASQRAQSSGSGSTSHSMRRRSCDSYETWSKSVQASFSTLIACASKLLKTRGSDVAVVLLPSPPPSPPLSPPPPPSAPHAHEARREVFACMRRGGAGTSVSTGWCMWERGRGTATHLRQCSWRRPAPKCAPERSFAPGFAPAAQRLLLQARTGGGPPVGRMGKPGLRQPHVVV